MILASARMSFRAIEPRAVVALTVMSLALLSLVRRAGALRSLPLLNGGGIGDDRRTRHTSQGPSQGQGVGPEGTHLPDVMHRVVGADEIKAELIVVGDVHGCYNEMVTLLGRCGYRLGNQEDRERFSVLLAGDLVNKGPGNAEVVRTAREEGFLAVRGNHDNYALAAATGLGRFSETSASEGNSGRAKPPPWVEQLSSDDVRWLCSLPYTLSIPSLGCIIVHAGLVPGVPLEKQDAEAMSCMRNVVEGERGQGYEPRTHTTEGVAWAKAWKGPEHVYFGHDAKRGLQTEAFATGLDTGCVYGRSLTAVVLPGGKVVCVPAERVWSEPGGGKKKAA